MVPQLFGGGDATVVGPGAHRREERVLVVEDDFGRELFGTGDAPGAKKVEDVPEVLFETLVFVVKRAGKPEIVLGELVECFAAVVSGEVIPVLLIRGLAHRVHLSSQRLRESLWATSRSASTSRRA